MDKKAQKQPRKITARYLENAALYYSQRYATSAENFRAVMRRKIQRSCTFHKVPCEPHYPAVDAMIERFIACGLLNDKVFAEAKTGSLRRRGMSRQAIDAKLQAKGLSKESIRHALATVDEDSDLTDPEFSAAMAFAKRRRIGPYRKTPVDIKGKQREMAMMGRAGFSFEIARKTLDFEEDRE